MGGGGGFKPNTPLARNIDIFNADPHRIGRTAKMLVSVGGIYRFLAVGVIKVGVIKVGPFHMENAMVLGRWVVLV